MSLVGNMDIVDNMMLRSYQKGSSLFLKRKDPRGLAQRIIEQLEVVTPSASTPVRRLSGGNVQKVLVGREISSSPTVIMAAYPARGLDINSSYTIYNLLSQQKENGVAVIFCRRGSGRFNRAVRPYSGVKRRQDYRHCRREACDQGRNRAFDDKNGGACGQCVKRKNSTTSRSCVSQKRDHMVFWKSWLVRLAAIVLALIVCALIIVLITGYNPLEVYSSMWTGTFGSARKVWITLQKTAILLCISLAVTPAYKMRFWNIGAEGQVLIGCLATAACMIYFGNSMPPALLFPVMFLASVAAGAIWAMIPAVFRAKWGTNETLFTLMMNYVAMQLVSYFITFWENPAGSNSVGIINSISKGGWLPEVFGQKYLLNILIVAVLTVLMFIYLKYSKQGYELTVVGESENTARYIGINIKRSSSARC